MGDSPSTSLDHVDAASFDDLVVFLRKARDTRTHDPEAVARYGSVLLQKYWKKLSQVELWLVHEQVAIAALELHDEKLATALVRNVHTRFPKGSRASRLAGMLGEASGRLSQAESLYSRELDVAPDSQPILKRKVAMLKEGGDTLGALGLLRSYLATNQMDWQAWEESAELYLQLQLYQQATFCLEEVLLHQPTSMGTHLVLADTLCTLGGAANLAAARQHYSAVVELSGGNNVRALYGLTYTAAKLGAEKKGAKLAGGPALAAAAAETLTDIYNESALPAQQKMLSAMLKAQGVLGGAAASPSKN